MNIWRFNYFIADYLLNYVEKTGDWNNADKIAERISNEIHSLINSDLCPDDFFDE